MSYLKLKSCHVIEEKVGYIVYLKNHDSSSTPVVKCTTPSHNSVLLSPFTTCRWILARVKTRQVPIMEQDLYIPLEYMISPQVLWVPVVQSLTFCVKCFVVHCFLFCLVCALPLAIIFYVLRFTASNSPWHLQLLLSLLRYETSMREHFRIAKVNPGFICKP